MKPARYRLYDVGTDGTRTCFADLEATDTPPVWADVLNGRAEADMVVDFTTGFQWTGKCRANGL